VSSASSASVFDLLVEVRFGTAGVSSRLSSWSTLPPCLSLHSAPVRLGDLSLAVVLGAGMLSLELVDTAALPVAVRFGAVLLARLAAVFVAAVGTDGLRRIPVSTGDGGDGANCGSFGLGLGGNAPAVAGQ